MSPGCHSEERQRRSNPQQQDEQDCRVAIASRNDDWGNDNEGFVCSCQASSEKLDTGAASSAWDRFYPCSFVFICGSGSL
jgi:hypothetical protein